VKVENNNFAPMRQRYSGGPAAMSWRKRGIDFESVLTILVPIVAHLG
jgi:hypothetical protein